MLRKTFIVVAKENQWKYKSLHRTRMWALWCEKKLHLFEFVSFRTLYKFQTTVKLEFKITDKRTIAACKFVQNHKN